MSEHLYKTDRETLKKQNQEKEGPSTTPFDLETADLLELQRMIGNQGVQRMLAQRELDAPGQSSTFIQTKLAVGPADDRYEQEADNVAGQVMSMPDAVQRQDEEEDLMQGKPDYAQRQEDEEEDLQMKRDYLQRQEEEELMQGKPDYAQRQEDEEEDLQMKRDYLQRQDEEELMQGKPDYAQRQEEEELMQGKRDVIQRKDMNAGFEVGGDVEENIRSQKGSGQPLPDVSREFFETRFGRDFSNVQVHEDSQSDSLNKSLSSRAFTTGTDVFFKQGDYNPDSSSGKELLAHELTHVVQQGGAGVKKESEKE